MKHYIYVLLAAALLGLGSVGQAATFVVDDSQSQVLNPNLSLQWRSLSPSNGDHQVEGVTRVQIRLDTRAWAGQVGRVFMALPAQPGGSVKANWQAANGQLLNGQLNSGQRGLVWSGVIPAALDDVLTVTIQTDGRLLSAPQALRFYFEIDLP
jgi:hypothetical protein